jgi:hypothetical protein
MKRLFAIVLLGLLVLGSAGLSGGAAAGLANCAPESASILDDVEAMANPVSYAERASVARRADLAEAPQLACNSACARACAARFGRCPTRECRQQFSACVRGCGC